MVSPRILPIRPSPGARAGFRRGRVEAETGGSGGKDTETETRRKVNSECFITPAVHAGSAVRRRSRVTLPSHPAPPGSGTISELLLLDARRQAAVGALWATVRAPTPFAPRRRSRKHAAVLHGRGGATGRLLAALLDGGVFRGRAPPLAARAPEQPARMGDVRGRVLLVRWRGKVGVVEERLVHGIHWRCKEHIGAGRWGVIEGVFRGWVVIKWVVGGCEDGRQWTLHFQVIDVFALRSAWRRGASVALLAHDRTQGPW